MLDAMLGSCNVVMAKQCSISVQSQHAAVPPSETEREMELPLLNHNSHVQELRCDAPDAERCPPPSRGGSGEFQALATLPVELVADLPAGHKPGTPIVMHGPHGPVQVVPPDELEPGSRVRFRLAPAPEFRIQVPSDCGPGSNIRFERSDGVEVAVAVPPHLQAGDVFEVTPPSMMVRVPEGAQAGDRVVFCHSIAAGPNGREAIEWCRVEVPKRVRPGSYFTARLPKPEIKRCPEEAPMRPNGDVMGDVMGPGSCMSVQGLIDDTEDI